MDLLWVARQAVFFPFFLIGCIALISSKNAFAQCSFSSELYFDPLIFPQYPTSFDGNKYANENAALNAAKQSYFGSAGSYNNPSTREICIGKYISMDLSLVQGGGEGEIYFWESGVYPLSTFAGLWVLQVTALQGFCSGGVVTKTRQIVYAPGPILTCRQIDVPTLSFAGYSETRPAGTGGTSTITFTAKTTSPNGQPKAGVSLSFSVDVKPNSGGHDHHSTIRPKGTLSPTQGVTNANGELAVTFSAPEFAGIHTIKATCPSCSNKEVSKEIQVRVSDLLPISPNPPTDADGVFVYALTSVDKTHQGNGRYHANQYYLTEQSRQNLRSMIAAFSAEGWGTVALNDASLYWGGRYDIESNWSGSHRGHRQGREIDISFSRARNPVPVSKQNVFYKKFCEDKAVQIPLSILHHYVKNPHFHVYLERQTACWKSEE